MVSYREVGIIAGASVLGAICVGVFLGVLLLRRKGVKLPPDSPPRGLPRSLQDKRPKTAEVAVKGKERAEFLARLRLLRSDAPYIFRMMAATRNRFRSGSAAAGHEAPSDAKTKACKAVVRDLSRVLCLLSLKEEHLKTAPKDWRCLLSWTERLLARYKRQEELKAMGEGFADPLKNTPGHPVATRTLFVTRQQQLKADQEKRRLEAKASHLGSEGGMDSPSKEPEEVTSPRPLSPLQLGYKDFYDQNNLIISKIQTPHVQFTPEDLPLKKCPEFQDKPFMGKNSKKKLKEFLSLNKLLWLGLMSSRGNKENDLEKGPGKVTNTSTTVGNFDDFSPATDDISSEIFFEHIEAFVFDLEDTTDQNNQKSLENTDMNQEDIGNPEGTLSNNKKFKSNLDLYKNYKNSRLLSGVRPMFSPIGSRTDIYQNQKQKEHSSTKEKRSSKLRRLSSSILSKDKRPLTLNRREDHSRQKKRRPLKRQKQVEKQKRSKIHEKYQSKSFQEDSSVSSEEHQSTIEVLNTSITQNREGNNDLYLSVIKTPVSSRPPNRKVVNIAPSHYKVVLDPNPVSNLISVDFDSTDHIQQSEDSKIKIKVPCMNQHRRCDPNISNHQNPSNDTRQLRNSLPKCEVLTDV